MNTKKIIHKEVYCGSELEKIQENNIESNDEKRQDRGKRC